nr:hypothetical protein BaRGS_007267 [Batillaria attramentaria]
MIFAGSELIQQWIHWIQRHYHRLHHQPYFVPLVHFNRLTFEPDIIEGVQVKVITPSKQLSDVRENESHSRVHYCFYHLFQMLKEVLFAVWGLDFDTYLNNLGAVEDTKPLGPPSSGAKQPRLTSQRHEPKDRNLSKTAAHRNSSSFFLRPRDLSTELQRGTFDVLLIAKDHGIVVCEIKAIGDAFGLPAPGMGNVDELEIIRGKVKKALKQLDKEKKVLRRLTEDLDPSLSIRSTLILPNLKKKTLEAALHVDQALKLDFCTSMGCTSLPDALERCVFAEQLPPIGKPWDMDNDVTEKLTTWWRLLVGNDRIEDQVYEGLVARFCGPATPLHVNTACRSRVEVSTLSDAVLETADCFKDWTLSEDQACIVKKDGERRVFLTGPPGTGKTTMMVLRALRWAHRGHVVYVISLWTGSDAASHHIVRLRLESVTPSVGELQVWAASQFFGSRPKTFKEVMRK